jgi:hypothetical protein
MPQYMYKCEDCPPQENGKPRKFLTTHSMADTKIDQFCPEGHLLKRIFLPSTITWRHAAMGMEIYTNEADAVEQLSSMIEITD